MFYSSAELHQYVRVMFVENVGTVVLLKGMKVIPYSYTIMLGKIGHTTLHISTLMLFFITKRIPFQNFSSKTWL